jgi:hypothetical protein
MISLTERDFKIKKRGEARLARPIVDLVVKFLFRARVLYLADLFLKVWIPVKPIIKGEASP